MSQTLFTAKKMVPKKSNWIKKSILGSVMLTVIGALGFGVYQAADTSAVSSQRQSRFTHSAREQHTSQFNTVPAFASKSQNSRNVSHSSYTSKTKKRLSSHSAIKHKKHSKKMAGHKSHGRHKKADLSKLSRSHKKHLAKTKKFHHKKHVVKSKKGKRSPKQLASK